MSHGVTGRMRIRRTSEASLEELDNVSSTENSAALDNDSHRGSRLPARRETRNESSGSMSARTFFYTVRAWLFDPKSTAMVAVVLMLFELVLCPLIINLVPYTEIDWQAYMDQVGMVHNGTLHYGKIHGRTGPLVYPAGFVWIFYALYLLTSGGVLVRVAQYAFAFFYILNLAVVMELYRKTQLVSPIALMFLTFGAKRVHSIFLLRMFNDPIAMLLAYVSFYALVQDWPIVFCALYSLSVSVKMNTLLFAPAILFILYHRYGQFKTVHGLLVCAGVQLAVAVPFISVSWWHYIWKAFEFQRKFMHKWTVNYRFLPESVFMHWTFHVGLLVGQLAVLAAAYYIIWQPFESLLKYGAKPKNSDAEDELPASDISQSSAPSLNDSTRTSNRTDQAREKKESSVAEPAVNADAENVPDDVSMQAFTSDVWLALRNYVLPPNAHTVDPVELKEKNRALLLILFSSNLIGIAFARTLHYQFYSWYFHQLPFLLWNTPYPLVMRLLILGVVEFCYLAYPSTVYSSALLHVCHAAIIVGLFLRSLKTSIRPKIATA